MLNKIFSQKERDIICKYTPYMLRQSLAHFGLIIHTRQMKNLYGTFKSSVGNDKKIVFWEAGGMPALLSIDAIIAFALRMRGTDVHMVICDGTYRACIRRDSRHPVSVSEWPGLCRRCRSETADLMKTFNLPYSGMGDHISVTEKERAWAFSQTRTISTLDNITYDSVDISNNIQTSIKRYLMGSELNLENSIVQEYVYSGLICASSAGNLIKKYQPSHLFMTHGIYVDWGPARLIARSKEIPVVGWAESYLQGHYFFGQNVDKTTMDMFNMSPWAWEYYKNAPLKSDQLQYLENYLKMRYVDNSSLDLRILSEYSDNTKKFQDKYHVTKNKPTWAIFSHIFWDNAADFFPLVYVSFEEWMLDTIKTIREIPELNWLIKVHPAEIWWGDKDHGVQKLIEKNFSSLPENINIIPPDEKINPFNFYSMIDGGITSCGTVGLELSILGKPVILAGSPPYGGKGFTYDGTTPNIYRQYLRNAQTLQNLDDEQHLLAQKYGYCYFIRKQIPVPMTCDKNPKTWVGTIHFDRRKSLVPHNDLFIDFICEKILDGSDFIMDDNLVALAEQLEKCS